MHYWVAADGRKFVKSNNEYVIADLQQLAMRDMERRLKSKKHKKGPNKAEFGVDTHYTGDKKGLVILVNFTDVKFQDENDNARYKRILNEKDYTSKEGHKGSVNDYFHDQSNGQFNLTFDVVGPYQLKNKQSYYGGNDKNGDDKAPAEMVVEAIEMASKEVNFEDYDWDGDKEVDQVFVVYAGQGEADSYVDDTIWPHEWTLSDAGVGSKVYNGITL